MPLETLRPTTVSGRVNLTGGAADIDQDPDGTITDPGLIAPDPTALPGQVWPNTYMNSLSAATGFTGFAFGGSTANALDQDSATFSTEASGTTARSSFFRVSTTPAFDLPSNATPTSVEILIKHRAGTASRVLAFIQWGSANGTLQGTELPVPSAGTFVPTTAGGVTSTLTLTNVPNRANLNNGTSGLRLRIDRAAGASTYELYSIRVKVNYDLAGQTLDTEAMVTLAPTPSAPLVGGGLQGDLRYRVRKKGAGTSPTARIDLYSGGVLVHTGPNATVNATTASGGMFSYNFNQSVITNPANIQAKFVGTGALEGVAELVALEYDATTADIIPPAAPANLTLASSIQ